MIDREQYMPGPASSRTFDNTPFEELSPSRRATRHHQRPREQQRDQNIGHQGHQKKVSRHKDRMRHVRHQEQRDDRSHHRRRGARDDRQLPEQNRFDEADERGLEAVTEVHLPVTAHRAAEVEPVRLHRRYHGHLGVAVSRLGTDEQRSVAEELKQGDYRGDAEQCGRRHGNSLLRESAVAHFAPLRCRLEKVNHALDIVKPVAYHPPCAPTDSFAGSPRASTSLAIAGRCSSSANCSFAGRLGIPICGSAFLGSRRTCSPTGYATWRRRGCFAETCRRPRRPRPYMCSPRAAKRSRRSSPRSAGGPRRCSRRRRRTTSSFPTGWCYRRDSISPTARRASRPYASKSAIETNASRLRQRTGG